MASTGYAYFGKFASHDGYLLQHAGHAEVGRLISELATPDEALVVLGDRALVNHQLFFYYSGARHYPFVYWWEDLLSGTLQGRGENAWARLGSWERKILQKRKKIFYVFGVGPCYYEQPGWNFYTQVDWSEFRQLHPKLEPVKTVYFRSGIPALKLFVVDASTPAYTTLPIQGLPARLEFYADRVSSFDYGEISGPVKALSWLNNEGLVNLPLSLTPQQNAILTFGPGSLLKLEASFHSGAFGKDVYEIENLSRDTERPCLVLKSTTGRLVYKVAAPGPIDRLTIIAMPNLHHDAGRKNQFVISYSLDGSHYIPVSEEKSDGSGRWTRQIKEPYYPYGSMEHWVETYQEIRPGSETVFVAFEFRGAAGEVELWGDASQDRPLLISARLDTSNLPALAYQKGFNTINIDGQESSTRLNVATLQPVKITRVYESEDALGFTGNSVTDADASGGRARFASAHTDVESLLVYGPSQSVVEGDYVAEFNLKTNDNGRAERIAVLDVYAVRDNKVVFLRELPVVATDFKAPGEYQKFYIPFSSAGLESFQYRVLWGGKADLWVDRVVVMDQSVLPPALLVKVRALPCSPAGIWPGSD